MITPQSRMETVTRFWEIFLNPDQASELSTLITPDVAFRGTLGVVKVGPKGLAEYGAQVVQVFEGFSVKVNTQIAQDDTVASRLTFSGRHVQAIYSVPPTGRRIIYPGMSWSRFEGKKIAEIWVMGDAATWMERLCADTH